MPWPPWHFWIDVGGTFTDCIGRSPEGHLRRHKVLSSGIVKGSVGFGSTRQAIYDPLRRLDPEGFWTDCPLRLLDRRGEVLAVARVAEFDAAAGLLRLAERLECPVRKGTAYELVPGEEAPVLGIRYLLGLRRGQPMPPASIRLGTTRGTNALLTRSGPPTALVTTRGFGDILHIGYQDRPHLFELDIRKREPLHKRVVEVSERVSHRGEVLIPLDEEETQSQLAQLRREGIESLAICFLHAYRFPHHEARVRDIARGLGFAEISVSHEVAPVIKLVSRGDVAVLDAFLNPVLRRYLEHLREAFPPGSLQLLTSAGGLVKAEHFSGKDSLLSGPAGGVVGYSRVAQAAGFERAIGFDMGGTSTDVSRFDGRFEYEFETEKGGARIVTTMMAIETVAAGGGSICRFDGVKLSVGPDSAGAQPGPACYGRGGPLAVTDLNVYLGKIPPDRFPFPLDRRAVRARLAAVRDAIRAATGRSYSLVKLAQGFLHIANTKMVEAIRTISIAKGYDPRHYVLVPFGGAAAQHGCEVARELGINYVLCHRDAGLLSALGLGLADVTRHRAAGVYKPYSEQAILDLGPLWDQLAQPAVAEIAREGISPDRIEIRRSLDLRYEGLDSFLHIPEPAEESYRRAYEREHERIYGYARPERALEIVAARVEVVGRGDFKLETSERCPLRTRPAARFTKAWFAGGALRTAVYDRESLHPGDCLCGPAIVCEPHATTVIDPGWTAEVLGGGELLLADATGGERRAASSDADPIQLEVFNNHFRAIAEQMGISLRNTATSVNVKERLDFSCALFTSRGELVVNAPHIPVHLGAMGESVRCILEDNPRMRAGDVFVTNDPYRGGSHLPDVTVVAPVYDASGERLLFFVASRAHHAEIGGMAPGSMPPFSRCLAEEGVLIRNFRLFDQGRARFSELELLLRGAPYPSRAVEDNLADIAAQVAALRQGTRDLLKLVERYSLPVVLAYMNHIQQAAESKMRSALLRLKDVQYHMEDFLDDGTPIRVQISLRGGEATVDFTGTGPVSRGNVNANRAIVTAAVMYCFRCLIGEDIPLNHGILRPLEIILPQCLLNPPSAEDPANCPAVVGGNVETSQRVVDVILGALGLAAASQGTMNNLVFGNSRFGYYETICGGAGATPNAPGADAVHTHLTNTRLTDPEVLEMRFPVRVREFAIRRGSGGRGQHRGGDGARRVLEFLEELDVSILSQRRGPYPPFGLQGGLPGAPGRNVLVRADGTLERLPGAARFTAHPGDWLVLETPGGGGYGAPFTATTDA